MSAIELDRMSLALGGRVVLGDISLSIEPGEFIGVLGPNGAGKTTLMRALLGLIRPAAGHIAVLGETPRRGNPAIGYVPQSRAVATGSRLSGRALLASSIGGERWGLPLLSAAGRADLDAALAAVGAAGLADRPLTAMSGGERQRLLLAQALLGGPRLLLLDEPLIGLDPRHQAAVVRLVAQLARERSITVLFSAHELNQLLGAVDRVLYLGSRQAALGTVAAVVQPDILSRLYGAPIEVFRRGRHIFVVSDGAEVGAEAHLHDDDEHGGHNHRSAVAAH